MSDPNQHQNPNMPFTEADVSPLPITKFELDAAIDEFRREIRSEVEELSRKYHDLWSESAPGSPHDLVFSALSTAFEDLWNGLER